MWGTCLECPPPAARKLCFAMLSDDQLTSPQRGVYELFDSGVAEDVTESAAVTEEVTEAEELPIEARILGDSPSGTWAFSVQDGGMVPRELVLRRKRYSF
jgi:hypothetical protein